MTSDLADHSTDTPFDLLTGRPYPEPTVAQPEADEIEAMLLDRARITTDGCEDVDPDGTCCHRHPSRLLRLGIL